MKWIKIEILITSMVLCACGYISDIDLPDTAQPNSIIPVVVEVTMNQASPGAHGACSIMLPIGWSVDEVYYNGASSGTMTTINQLADYLTYEFPPPADFMWLSFLSTESCSPDSGDVFNVHMTVHNDSLEGTINLAFHVAWYDMCWLWDDDPVPDSIIVQELAFNQITWTTIKANFSE